MSQNRKQRIGVLVKARTDFAGIGTRRAKLLLNRLAKVDEYARAIRIALEIEDANLTAKRYFGGDCGGRTYADINYERKCASIVALMAIAQTEGWMFGVQPSDVGNTTHIIYFEIPGAGQVSWHYSPNEVLPVYPGRWDGKAGSTLAKLEAAVLMLTTKVAA